MAASETCSTVLESPEPDPPCRTPPPEQDQKQEDEEDEEDDTSEQELADPDCVEERFRIDRKKLELMLYAPVESSGPSGEEFFEKVMRETNTQVKWPSKLKIGAKSKKDPHVKVEGRRADVLEAKRKILEILETKVNKVTLKMDVTHTEHSHVIGKGGGNIKKVMEDTSCHIHFPDSNRSNCVGEKSNQDLQPLVLTFDLPVTLAGGVVADTSSPVIQHVAQAFGVSVSFRTHPKLYCSTCSIRGVAGHTADVKKATCVLMELLLGPAVNGVMVSTQLDVISQQHLFLLGQNGANFLSVMHQTHTQILLPDLSAPQHSPSLLIQGTADGVCLARQQLMDCLPVCLMFDLKDEGESDPRKLGQMMQNLGVFISVKPKLKQTTKVQYFRHRVPLTQGQTLTSVVVKGLERNIGNVYEARRLLLGLDSNEVSMGTKSVSETSPMSSSSLETLLANGGITGYWLNLLMQQLRLSDTESVIGSLSGKSRPTPLPPPGLAVSSEEGRIGLKGVESKLEKIPENDDQQAVEETTAQTEGTEVQEVKPISSSSSSRRSSQPETGIHSHMSERSVRMEVDDVYWNRDRRCSLRVFSSMDNSQDREYERKKLLASQAMQQKPVVTEVRTPTDTWSGLGFSKSMPTDAVKELRAVSRRCYRPYHNNLNQNNNQQQQLQSWSGKDHGWNGSNSENWRERRGSVPSSPSSSSSFLTFSSAAPRTSDSFLTCTEDGAPVSRHSVGQSPSPTHADDLIELLVQLGLEKYVHVFQQQEIDYQTFLTLSDEDLKEVGVNTFGARRKMLLAIAGLSKKRKLSEGSAVKSGYLEGGASGRLPRIMDDDVAAKSNRW
ncbi:hypothetical protein DNTS_030139 [Danionella cerebrum]|uniref:SAM domain-containing protein n=1 Tax=Danionella cerebrum TaxID=2873325 RepID=A0A553QMY1_9TELE|nr:hypothetical protein DNTS_030139 [Danionella translucida]